MSDYLIGITAFNAGWYAPKTTAPMPVGTATWGQVGENTQEDDLLILMLLGGYGDGQANCDDPRMTELTGDPLGGRAGGVWIGYAGDLSPLSIALQGNYSAIGQFASGVLMAYRGATWDPDRIANSDLDGSYGGAGDIPAVPGFGSGAFLMIQSIGGVGGSYFGLNFKGTPYFRLTSDNGSYTTNVIGQSYEDPVAAVHAIQQSTGLFWRAIAVGFDVVGYDPIRLYPRDDGLGRMSPAPRLFPPVRTADKRLVGGLQ